MTRSAMKGLLLVLLVTVCVDAAPITATIHYRRADGNYGDYTSNDFNDYWGLHLWGEGLDVGVATAWTSPKKINGTDGFGVLWQFAVADDTKPVNFIIHRGDTKDPGPDQSFIPGLYPEVWVNSGDETVYPSLDAANGVPEPGAVALLVVGLSSAALTRRRGACRPSRRRL